MFYISITILFDYIIYKEMITFSFKDSGNSASSKDTLKIKGILNVSPQETAIAPNLTVKENLEFMAGVYQIKYKVIL